MGLYYNDRNSFNRFNISRNKGDKTMINGIKPNPMVGDFDKAMDRLVENIHQDYKGWRTRSKYDNMPGAFPDVDITMVCKLIKVI